MGDFLRGQDFGGWDAESRMELQISGEKKKRQRGRVFPDKPRPWGGGGGVKVKEGAFREDPAAEEGEEEAGKEPPAEAEEEEMIFDGKKDTAFSYRREELKTQPVLLERSRLDK